MNKTPESDVKILLLGSTGLLGSTLQPFLDSRGYHVITHGCSNSAQYQADITDPKQTNKLFDDVQPDIVINLVGMTNVDRCETDQSQACLTNVKVVENISTWIKKSEIPCHLIHISTDQVYDGSGLHSEDNVSLTNYYAFSKYAGELVAASVSGSILRTNFFGRSHCEKRDSFTDWLYSSLTDDKSIQVFDDVLFSPLSMDTLASMIEQVVQKKPKGIFNVGSLSGMNKADFSFLFANELDLSTSNMTRTSSDKVTFLKTYRPKDMRMDCSNFENILGIKLPCLQDELKKVTSEYNEKP